MFERAEAAHVTIGVLLNLGDCYEKVGRLANARSKFEDAELAAMPQALRARLEEHFQPFDEQLVAWLGRTPSWRR